MLLSVPRIINMRNNKLNYWKILASFKKRKIKKENHYKVYEQNTLSTKFLALFNFQMQIIPNPCQPVTYKATGWHACTCAEEVGYCTALRMTLDLWDWAQSHIAFYFIIWHFAQLVYCNKEKQMY